MGTESCTIRPGTLWIRRLEWLKGPTLKSWKISSLPMTPLQCGKAWKPSPSTGHHPPALRWINNLLRTWMSCIVDLKPPTPSWPSLYTTVNTTSNPPLPHSCTSDQWRRCAPVFRKNKRRKAPGKTVWHQPVWKPVLTSWPPSSHRSSIDLCVVWSPFLLQTLHHHPCSKETHDNRT